MSLMQGTYKNINLQDFLATLIIYVITFPSFEPDFSIGLDHSYFWALSHLFAYDYATLKQIIYPYGPLGFLKNPVVEGHCLEWALLFHTITKVWFVYLFIRMAGRQEGRKEVAYFAVTIIIWVANIDLILIGLTFIHSFHFLGHRAYPHLVAATMAAFLGICIKSSIGISAFSIIAIAFVLDGLQNRNTRAALTFAGVVSLVVLCFGMLVFHDVQLLLHYLFNVLRLTVSYSSALSLFPPNNWLFLFIAIACAFLPAWISTGHKGRVAFLLLLPSLFAAWKHAISRQDDSHAGIMLAFLFLYWGLLLVVAGMGVKRTLLLAVVSISLFYSNMQNTWNFKPRQVPLNGIINFEHTVLGFKGFKTYFLEKSAKNIKDNKLSPEIISIIGEKTVDSYPWELSYFAANKELKWKMRRTLQSGSFATWLDQCNAEDFSRENGPDFLIFHYLDDRWGGKFGSVDDKYLLNDTPLTIYNIFNYYSLRLKADGFLLLEKNDADNFLPLGKTGIRSARWGEWMNLGDMEEGWVARVLLQSGQNPLGKAKGFLYKTEPYFIDYMTQDGKVFTFRFIPSNAKEGLWLTPMIRNPQNAYVEDKVLRFRLRCSHPMLNEKELKYQVETIKYVGGGQTGFQSYFLKHKIPVVVPFPYGNNPAGQGVQQVERNGGFSSGYSIGLDTLWQKVDEGVDTIFLETDVRYLNVQSEGYHVVSLTGSQNDFWEGAKITADGGDAWRHSLQIITLNRHQHSEGILKVYVWNPGAAGMHIDGLKLQFRAVPHESENSQ